MVWVWGALRVMQDERLRTNDEKRWHQFLRISFMLLITRAKFGGKKGRKNAQLVKATSDLVNEPFDLVSFLFRFR